MRCSPCAALMTVAVAWTVSCVAPLPPEEPWVASGGCADRLAQGPYQVTSATGKTRVTGSFEKGRMQGTFEFFGSLGQKIARIPYREDRIDGTVELWYWSPAGVPKLESSYRAGRHDGVSRGWYSSGELRSVVVYAAGTLEQAQYWTRDGRPLTGDIDAQVAHDEAADRELYDALERIVRDYPVVCE